MLFYIWCICTICLALLPAIPSINARLLQDSNETVSKTVVVDPSGQGDFKTIQAAIDSVPSQNQRWICIDIKQGQYREKVTIGLDKPFIYLKGAGKDNTFIVWDGHDDITDSTFASEASNTIARDITFTNSFTSTNGTERAVAARVKGDKSAFYRCGFISLQDTLWDVQGRHYFKDCTMEGAIDFIFGAGQTLYEGCTISVTAGALDGTLGYITAQARGTPEDTSGFVFKNCRVDGTGKAYLGRPWRDYARVLFYDTEMSDVVAVQGWDPAFSTGKENQLELSEYKCRGPGAQSSERVAWEKKLSEEEVEKLTSISFIDDQGWLETAVKILGA